MAATSTIPITQEAIVAGLVADLGMVDREYRVIQVLENIGEFEGYLFKTEKVIASLPTTPSGKPKIPVPFTRAYVSIVSRARVPGLKGAYFLDDQHALILGEWDTIRGVKTFVPTNTVSLNVTLDVVRFIFGAKPVRATGEWKFEGAYGIPNLFSFEAVSRTNLYRSIRAKILDKMVDEASSKKKRSDPKDPDYEAYLASLKIGLQPFFPDRPGKGDRFIDTAGQVIKTRSPRVQPTGEPWDKKFRDWMIGAGTVLPASPYPLAVRMLKETEYQPILEAKNRGSEPSASQKEVINPYVIELLEQHGIDVPPFPAGGSKSDFLAWLGQMEHRLKELERTLETGYDHSVPKGRQYDMLRERAESPELFEELVARLNSRRPRKPRPPRAARGAKNPLPEEQVYALTEWAERPVSKRGEPPTESEQLKQLQAVALGWPISRVAELFPDKGKVSEMSLRAKAPTLTKTDAISRVRDLGISRELAEEIGNFPEFYREDKFVEPMVRASELSFETASDILDRQKRAARGGKTVQASTALLQGIRVQRLSAYRLPAALIQAGGPKKAVIWLSPEGYPFRVMSIRRNTHIDADLIPIKGLTPTTAVAKALQAALYWLAEDPKRTDPEKGATLYIGRIGRPSLSVAWAPTEPLTLEQVQRNLGRTIDGVSAARTVKMSGYDAEKDIQSFVQALSKVRQRAEPDVLPSVPPEREIPKDYTSLQEMEEPGSFSVENEEEGWASDDDALEALRSSTF